MKLDSVIEAERPQVTVSKDRVLFSRERAAHPANGRTNPEERNQDVTHSRRTRALAHWSSIHRVRAHDALPADPGPAQAGHELFDEFTLIFLAHSAFVWLTLTFASPTVMRRPP